MGDWFVVTNPDGLTSLRDNGAVKEGITSEGMLDWTDNSAPGDVANFDGSVYQCINDPIVPMDIPPRRPPQGV